MNDPRRCPKKECRGHSRVVETDESRRSCKRRRQCLKCGLRWTTREIPDGDFQRLCRVEDMGFAALLEPPKVGAG